MAKFMPCYDGPYTVIDIDEQHSTVTLDLPNSANIFPTFHTSQIIPYIESDTEKIPSHHFEEPQLIITEDGVEVPHGLLMMPSVFLLRAFILFYFHFCPFFLFNRLSY